MLEIQVMRADDLMEVDTSETDYLLGLLGEGHVEYDSERVEGRDPTLEQMVEVALQVRNLSFCPHRVFLHKTFI